MDKLNTNTSPLPSARLINIEIEGSNAVDQPVNIRTVFNKFEGVELKNTNRTKAYTKLNQNLNKNEAINK